jgi:hypothetical protein
MMNTNQTTLIEEQILLLKVKQAQQFTTLKNHLQATGESLKPMNILKTTATEVVSLVKAEGNILNKMIELGVGEIGKKAVSLVGNNKVGRILKSVLSIFTKKI